MHRDLRQPPHLIDRGRCYIFGGGNAQAGATVEAAGVTSAAQIAAAQAAASAQEHAADVASQTQLHMYDTTRGDLMPYNTAGQQSENMLIGQLGDLTSPVTMNQATLESTPGYQFTRTQGLKGVQNSAAARGLGVSGAALKGAAGFATGLADNTYQQQFQNAWANKQNAYNMLIGPATLGEDAAAKTGNAGTAAANGIASAQIGAGNAAAGGYAGIANGVSNFANTVGAMNYLGGGMYGGGGGSSSGQGWASDPQFVNNPDLLPPF